MDSDKQKESPTLVRLPFKVDEPVRVYLECPHCKGPVKLCIDPSTPDVAESPTAAGPGDRL